MIALTIFGYWAGMAIFMWAVMFGCLCFARLCEYTVDFLFKK
jgi:hypothetical protein